MVDIRDLYNKIILQGLFILLFPTFLWAEKVEKRTFDKPIVSDSIMQNVFQFAPFYSRIIDEYKADIYMKGRVKVLKNNKLLRYIPTVIRVEEEVDDYILESLSEMHYTAPDIYNRKMKAKISTMKKDRNFENLTYFLKMNVYSSSLFSDKLLSPLDEECAKHYIYLLDSVAGPSDSLKYKIRIVPKFKGTQLVSGYMWISDQVWTIRELEITWKYNMLECTMKTVMGDEGADEEFLPIYQDVNADFRFMGNHLNMSAKTWLLYNEVSYYKGEERRKSQKKHQHDLTEFYELVIDSTQMVTDWKRFEKMRPIPLLSEENSLYLDYQQRNDSLNVQRKEDGKKISKSSVFWGQVGDMMVNSYNVNLPEMGTVRCSPLINPMMFSYSHSNGISYRQVFKYNKLFPNESLLKVTPRIGYYFTQKKLFVNGKIEYQYWPQKLGGFELDAGNNYIYSNVVVDRLQFIPDSVMTDFKKEVELDRFDEVYLNFLHSIEPWNGLLVKAGVSVYWRSLVDKNWMKIRNYLDKIDKGQFNVEDVRTNYNSFSPRIRIEWTPGLYYYMNGRRKMNIGSSFPTFILDYERGVKGVFGANDEHERLELEVQQKIKFHKISTLGYRAGIGFFTKQDNAHFVNFVNFKRSSLPVGWNDEIGGTFHLLDSRWYNSSRSYWRGNVSYESPFILLRPLNRWLGLIQQERLYGGILFMPHLNPYVELGYGIGTHVFDIGVFASSINGSFDTVGLKFTLELFND